MSSAIARTGVALVIAAPSGAGKSTISRALLAAETEVEAAGSVSALQSDRSRHLRRSGQGSASDRHVFPISTNSDPARHSRCRSKQPIRGRSGRLTNAQGTTALLAATGIGVGAPEEAAGTEPEVLETVELLLKLGADINTVDKNGETSMHGAAYRNHLLLPAR